MGAAANWGLVWLVMMGLGVGCVPHSVPLYAGTSAEITVETSRFLVRYTDTRAEATRLSPAVAPQRTVILSRALRAIEAVSGCKVRPGTLYGDWALIEAYLACPDGAQGQLQPVLTHRPPGLLGAGP